MNERSMVLLVGGAALLLVTPLLVVVLFLVQHETAAAACSVDAADLPVTAPPASTGGGPAGAGAGKDAAVAGDPRALGGQRGSGLQLGVLPTVNGAAPGTPVNGIVKMAVANLPEKARGGRGRSIGAIAAAHPDFIALNEVSSWSARELAGAAHGYGAYKDPLTNIHRAGGANSMENAVMWDSSKWHLVDAGRYEYVEHDLVVFKGRDVDWNRYATWAVLRRASDGKQVVVISTHAMTNPQAERRTHGDYQWPSRIAQYANGMRLLKQLIVKLAGYGPVLMAGDMNVHPSQGSWSAPDQMAQLGFGWTYDHAIVYQFFPHGTRAVGTRLIRVDSDHPHALLTAINLNGATANDTSGAPPASSQGSQAGQDGSDTTQPALDTSTATGPGCCPDSGGSLGATLADLAALSGLDAEQRKNAQILVSKGIAAGGTPAAIVGVTTALTESGLHIDPGSTGGAYGLMQQTPPGWGTKAQIMDPNYAAGRFYAALVAAPGWQAVPAWQAAQMVQHSGAGSATNGKANYGPKVAEATRIVDALAAGASTCGGESVDATGEGAGGHFTASRIDHVGQYTRVQLLARVREFIAHNGTPDLDPFFHSQSGSWYRACQHFVANLSGASASGYGSAAAAWATFQASGVAHLASGPDGMSPPVGAWLYYGPNHVTVYLGDNQVVSTDTWGNGTVNFGPASAETDGPWHLPYLGWVAPWGGGKR